MQRYLVIAITLISLLSLPVGAQEKKRTLQEIYNDAVKEFNAGEYESALEGFQTFLKHQPNYPYARAYVAQCQQKIRAGGKPKETLEAKLATLVVPSVNFESSSLALVFEFLTQKSEELSGGRVVANFIYKGSDEMKQNSAVSLSLRNAPFTDVIRYVGQLTNTVFTYEEFAVVATPVGTASASPATTATQSASLESKFDSNDLKPIPPANADPFSKR